MKNLNNYEIGEKVKVHIQIGNDREWREAKVVEKKTIYSERESRHKPYTMLVVEVIRTYFDTNTQKYYDKLSAEGYLYANQVKH